MEILILLDNQASREGAHTEAVSYGQQALQLARLLGDVVAEAKVLVSIGVRLAAQADLAGAQSSHQQALAIFHRLNMPESEAWVLGELGYTSIRLGDYDTAEQQLTAALAISTRLDDLFWQAWVKLRLGTLSNERGDAEKALAYITEAFQTAEQFQYLNFKAAVLGAWGELLLSQEEWDAAEHKFQEAYDFRQGAGRMEQALPSLAGLAFVIYQQGKLETAAAHAEKLWKIWQESPETAERADLTLYWMLGLVWDGLGDIRANDLWNKARALLHERCENIPDEAARKMFLEQVPAHQAILNNHKPGKSQLDATPDRSLG